LGDSAFSKVRDFSPALRPALREILGGLPSSPGDADPPTSDAAEDAGAESLINEILAEASWALPELHNVGLTLAKQEIRAEQQDLLKTLTPARDKLRALSDDFDRLLGAEADPRGCADHIDTLISHVMAAGEAATSLELKPKPRETRHHIAVEMAIRVLRVLQSHGIPASATAHDGYDDASKAVRILKAFGDDIDLALANTTWRDIISQAKAADPDLRS
jgi:hypothetical protein